MKAIKVDETNSVLIKDGDIEVWFDVYLEGSELSCDWNQYIFDLNNSKDLAIKEFQEKAENFDLASSLAIEYLEKKGVIKQLENGNWIKL